MPSPASAILSLTDWRSNLSGGLTRNLQVQDILPGGMVFVDTVSINGDTTATYTSPATGPHFQLRLCAHLIG